MRKKRQPRVLNVNDYTLARMTQKIDNALVPLTQMVNKYTQKEEGEKEVLLSRRGKNG